MYCGFLVFRYRNWVKWLGEGHLPFLAAVISASSRPQPVALPLFVALADRGGADGDGATGFSSSESWGDFEDPNKHAAGTQPWSFVFILVMKAHCADSSSSEILKKQDKTSDQLMNSKPFRVNTDSILEAAGEK